ncbi:flagellar hook-associated protein FlgK [Rhodovulum sp. BSW8]|uniref:Flagellar hook-associated protein 1 n=1 Tax=Rhodovulum visakhapatnamense TaxID=364297 RepID=A0A4R8G1T7_9RHOB|nr:MULTISPECIES: flagellar hook-associated protein FlgK [Rhodovulum]OLS43266.1 flagellar hook-associated protein FlgK [Rhodovulum sulfidophilum]MBL3568322.1 flagellar hook-associated protein FlgK [Rhodovulum visakhapatnamense]MBL3578847.1 flagellar hook-associated protein FlgK [Rhodovulum visakhapatnamense]RBO53211.1 flagellar hook-associated protein FlgK [Rhodovulum sp. BSW8]TDX31997.1 flagellar hook-associated protein 1 FlgK [Rhodovulum visakhapatnamense]
MSLSASLANALSGLNAASRGAQVVSSNVSNALTEGYGRRVLETTPNTVSTSGSGVKVVGVRRDVNQQLIGDRRFADAASAEAETRADGLSKLEAAFGTADSADSISGSIAAFESALTAAASRPDSDARLATVLSAAQSLTGRINDAADAIQQSRMDAESGIASTVQTLNDTLQQIAELNTEICKQYSYNNNANALVDQRQILIDKLAEIVPIREIPRDNGMVALYTENGAALIDGPPAEFSFSSAGVIVPQMTVEGGALNGLYMNGKPVKVSGTYAAMGGGSLEALFEQRDVTAVQAQTDLDALTRDLIERFQDPAVDASLGATDAGLFTNFGAAFDLVSDPNAETGLSTRIGVNALVDPDQGGALWRLRSGLMAGSAGSVGDASLLNSMSDALTASRTPSSGSYTTQAFTMADLASEVVSGISVRAQSAIDQSTFSTARAATLREAELADGVDTDHELQMLMLFEEAYAANAKVMKTIDELINLLMEL